MNELDKYDIEGLEIYLESLRNEIEKNPLTNTPFNVMALNMMIYVEKIIPKLKNQLNFK